MRIRTLALSVLLVPALGCAALQPALGSLISRVDVGRVIQCAKQPTAKDKARCLGAEAMTVGLGTALDEAARLSMLAMEKANAGAGAEVSDREARAIERDLRKALNVLADEIDATHGVE